MVIVQVDHSVTGFVIRMPGEQAVEENTPLKVLAFVRGFYGVRRPIDDIQVHFSAGQTGTLAITVNSKKPENTRQAFQRGVNAAQKP